MILKKKVMKLMNPMVNQMRMKIPRRGKQLVMKAIKMKRFSSPLLQDTRRPMKKWERTRSHNESNYYTLSYISCYECYMLQ
jgi:hypothetical protein